MSEPTPEISFDDFMKIDLHFGQVVAAELVPKSENLVKMQVSFGHVEKTILAGVAKSYSPDAIIGKVFLFVINLAPRKIMGIESHGMMLAAGEDVHALSLVTPVSSENPTPDTLVGSRVH